MAATTTAGDLRMKYPKKGGDMKILEILWFFIQNVLNAVLLALEILWFFIQNFLNTLWLVLLIQMCFAECWYLEINHNVIFGKEVCIK